MKKFLILFICISMLVGCGNKTKKEWTIEALEEEFGGIIEMDFDSTQDCLKLISNKDYSVCGYITDKTNVTLFGNDIYDITVSDDMNKSYKGNTVSIVITETAYDNVEIGDFIYAKGEYLFTYTDLKNMSCKGNDLYISPDKIKDSTSVAEYIQKTDKIYEETYFKTKGLVIQDGTHYDDSPRYYLYSSEKAYKEEKMTRIELKFINGESNLTGKTIIVIGKPDEEASCQGLKECSIVEEE